MRKLLLNDYVALYNLIVQIDADPFDTVDAIEELIPDLRALAGMGALERNSLAIDDTTTKMSHDLQTGAKKLLPVMEKIVSEYAGLSRHEIKLIVEGLKPILISQALILYTTGGFNTVLENLDGTNKLDLSQGVYSKYIVKLASESMNCVFDTAAKICGVLSEFNPFLPEYNLNDEDIADLHEAIFNANLPSDAIASLSPEFVSKVLGGD